MVLLSSNEEKILELIKAENPIDPIKFVNNIVCDYALDILNQNILDCNKCHISNVTKCLVKGDARIAKVLVLTGHVTREQAEAGEDSLFPLEYTEGYNFINDYLKELGINRKVLIWANVICCYPYHKLKAYEDDFAPRPPKLEEFNNCKTYVDRLLKIVNPKYILIFGNIALNAIYQEKKSIFDLHGEWININDIPAMATFDPNNVIANDFGRIKNQREYFLTEVSSFFEEVEKVYSKIRIIGYKRREWHE